MPSAWTPQSWRDKTRRSGSRLYQSGRFEDG